ncbi:MAG: restriction endonuclease subunit S [Terrestrivirus sp.]|uniref:Restriction endonuclease subunit S n=1 Tax=Terrestrivirus sp. TaxID=2487775 RepID=A0A3G4ZQA0_9VIRU|nr:MAG: restriction endonuclease subunit S [Terrestrivirus sp.]
MNKKLNELCTVNEGTHPTKNKEGLYQIFTPNPVLKEFSNDYNVIENTIIISIYGLHKGCIHKCDEKMWISSLYTYLTNIKTEIILEEYLYYYMKFNNENVLNKIKVKKSYEIRKEKIIENINIYVPSIEIQNKIILICGKIDDDNKKLNKKLRKIVKEINGKIQENKKFAEKIINEPPNSTDQNEIENVIDDPQKEMIIYI